MSTPNVPVQFEIFEGGKLLKTQVFTDQKIKIGRLSSSHLQLMDDSVSRMHAVIEFQDGVPVIQDLGSRQKTYLNGAPITREILSSGAALTIGRFDIRVSFKQARQAGGVGRGAAATDVPLFDPDDNGEGPRALEVLAVWHDTVVAARHLSEDEEFLIGNEGDVDQFVLSKLPVEPFVLATHQPSMISIDVPDGVRGEVMLKGEVYAIDALREQGKLVPSDQPNSARLKLPPTARCRLVFDDVTILLNSVAAAEPVSSGGFFKAFEPVFLGLLAMAAALHGLFFTIVLSMPADASSLALDRFELDERFVEILREPEEEKLEDLLKDEGDDGDEGKAARDDSGKLGKEEIEETQNRIAIQGMEEEIKFASKDERAEIARDLAEDIQADLASDPELAALFGEGSQTIGMDQLAALGNLSGEVVGESGGARGLGMAGVGSGGGGFGKGSLGAGRFGVKGVGSGKGKGYGRGVGKLGARKNRLPKVIPGRPIVMGSLDPEIIKRYIRKKRRQYQFCYSQQLQRYKNLTGTVKITFTITGSGRVVGAKVASAGTDLNNSTVQNCVKNVTAGIVFPQPKGGGIVKVTYPFRFKPN
jgi:TonB family protein